MSDLQEIIVAFLGTVAGLIFDEVVTSKKTKVIFVLCSTIITLIIAVVLFKNNQLNSYATTAICSVGVMNGIIIWQLFTRRQ